jgi:hypothetical protein
MSKVYVVKLTAEERAELRELVRKNKAASWKLDRARALLKCDQGPHGPGWPDARIVEAFGGTTRSLENWRKQAVESGPLSLLERKPQAKRATTIDGEQEAQLTKLACSQPPEGQARWSLRLLSRQAVELEIVEAVSHESVRRVLKKANLSRGGSRCGASRPSRTRRSSARWNKC